MKSKIFVLFSILQMLIVLNPIASAAPDSDEPVVAAVILDNPSGEPLSSPSEERFESSPSSPPLATDDPGTPGRHAFEINFITDCDHAQNGHACEGVIDAALGIGDRAQLRVSKGYSRERADGEPNFQGSGPTDIGVKFRFYDKNGLQIATFPSFRLDDATRRKDTDGNTLPSDGRSVYLPIIVSKDIGQNYTVVSNLAYEKNLDRADSNSVFTSVALGRSLGPDQKVMAEVESTVSTATGRNRTNFVRVGWAKVVFKSKTGRYHASLLTSIGRQVGPTDETGRHTPVMVALLVGVSR